MSKLQEKADNLEKSLSELTENVVGLKDEKIREGFQKRRKVWTLSILAPPSPSPPVWPELGEIFFGVFLMFSLHLANNETDFSNF